MVRCALLPDYYVRTGAETLKDVPQIKAEMTRIWADFDFVCSGPTWEQVPERMEEIGRAGSAGVARRGSGLKFHST